jgi:hypothetical protein
VKLAMARPSMRAFGSFAQASNAASARPRNQCALLIE